MNNENTQLVLIGGESGAGKSASLRLLEPQEGVMHLNTEANKRLPFANKFESYTIIDPLDVTAGLEAAEAPDKAHIHTCVIDSLTFMMDAFESQYVLPSTNTMQAWGDFQQFFKRLMQETVAASTKSVIFTAHVTSVYNEDLLAMQKFVPVKGALAKNGIESYFSTVVEARKVSVTDLEPYVENNALLTITEEEAMLGFKHVFQTRVTKDTVHTRIRSPMGLFSIPETFMDNDAAMLMNHLEEYYK